MALVDLKRDKQEKAEEAAESAPTAASQPDYGYGLCIHLEDAEIEKLGISPLPNVGTEFHIRAVAVVKGVSERDYGDRKEAGIDLQITMMECEAEPYEPGEESETAADEDREEGGGTTILRSTYRGR